MSEPNPQPKRDWMSGAAAGLIGLLIGGAAVGAWYGFRSPDRAATEAIVRDYILANGEIIPEAMERLQQSRTAEAVGRYRTELERPYRGAWAGAADGDVVLVYFFDYACGFCRSSNPDIERLLSEDPRLKVVWREYPVLGPESEQAAVASMAAAETGVFASSRQALRGRPRASDVAANPRGRGLGE